MQAIALTHAVEYNARGRSQDLNASHGWYSELLQLEEDFQGRSWRRLGGGKAFNAQDSLLPQFSKEWLPSTYRCFHYYIIEHNKNTAFNTTARLNQ